MSRRAAEDAISSGRVKVNREPASLGQQVSVGDDVNIDGWFYVVDEVFNRPKVYAYHKPDGEVCTANDPEGRKTVFTALPRLNGTRWVMVGRLDINTQGLLLFTTDGELANRLMHPSSEVERVYNVRVRGQVGEDVLQALSQGVELEDGVAAFTTLSWPQGEVESYNRWFTVGIKEGRNREVRRMWESQGLEVSRLIRRAYGEVVMPKGLHRGKGMFLDDKIVDSLCKSVGYSVESQLVLRDARKRPTKSKQEGRRSRR
ncbi:MAG: pseudouridine synthase [Gammaproteobacteria bacterium]|nr:pseudouridine synthase [Gammaproteobacteria bacterium]